MRKLPWIAITLMLATGVFADDQPGLTRGSLRSFCGQKVKFVGRYSSTRTIPDVNTAGVWVPGRQPIPHIRAKVVLPDGAEVQLGPPMHKSSLRTPQEAEAYEQKSVEIEGTLQNQSAGPGKAESYWIQPTSIRLVEP